MRNPLYLALLSIPTVLGVALAGPAAAAEAPCPVPKALRFEVEGKIVRDRVGLTQGLEFHDGKLFESTGRTEGETRLNTVGLDGKVTVLDDLGMAVFGEGLAILNGEVFQLTWQEHVVFVYDLSGKLLRKMTNPRLGWGLASDGKSLIFTDGEGALHYADPKTFKLTRSIPLRAAGGKPPVWLNELEYVDGKLFGNVFTTDWIVEVDPNTGCMVAASDLSFLRGTMSPAERGAVEESSEHVLNGIARNAATGLFYITGKRWPMIYVGRFRPAD